MKKHIITALLVLTCASVATAMRGPRTRPTYIQKQAPTVVATADAEATPKSTPRTPDTLSGYKSANVVSGKSKSKTHTAKHKGHPRLQYLHY